MNSKVIWASKFNNSMFPRSLESHSFVDLIVQVTDTMLIQVFCLNFGNHASDFLHNLHSPALRTLHGVLHRGQRRTAVKTAELFFLSQLGPSVEHRALQRNNQRTDPTKNAFATLNTKQSCTANQSNKHREQQSKEK